MVLLLSLLEDDPISNKPHLEVMMTSIAAHIAHYQALHVSFIPRRWTLAWIRTRRNKHRPRCPV